MRGPPARKAEPSEMSLAVRARLVLIPSSSRSQHLQISLPLSVHEVRVSDAHRNIMAISLRWVTLTESTLRQPFCLLLLRGDV